MRKSLKPNAIPKKVTGARRVPLRFKEGADTVVQDLMNKKVIVPVNITTDWCSPAFFVPKSNMIRVRLVTDYTHLNKYVKRPVHPFPCTAEILQAIPSTVTCFSKLDAVHGYFQLALEPKSSLITTFLLPQGKFRYLRAPMRLNASSDKRCCKSDIIVEGLPWARKLVDDTIIWADNEEDLVLRARTLLERRKANNITISRKKFKMGREIEIAGRIISDTGIKPDEKKFSAIRQFPTPTCIKDVRAFLGLANQLGSFIPDLAHMTSAIRPLLKKGLTWNWLPEYQASFEKIKDILTSDMVILPFDPNLDTILLTDASRFHGMGFALIQIKKGNMRLIQSASSSLTPTHQRYAVC